MVISSIKRIYCNKKIRRKFKYMYSLNSSMTILSLTLWFLSWESTARLTSGLHGTRFYSPLLLILIPYPLQFLRVIINITFLSFLFILVLSFLPSLCLYLIFSLSLFSWENENWGLKVVISAVVGWGREGCWRLCLRCAKGEHPVSLQREWEERDSPCSQQGGQELPSLRDGRKGDFRIERI